MAIPTTPEPYHDSDPQSRKKQSCVSNLPERPYEQPHYAVEP